MGSAPSGASALPVTGVSEGSSQAPARRRYTTGRGELVLGDERQEEPPCATIAKISIFKNDLLGMTRTNQRRLRPLIAFAIDNILESEDPFCLQDAGKLRRAVQYLEEREPRLAVCKASWGACALLSRSLGYRKAVPGRRRRRRAARVDPAAGSAADGSAGATTLPVESQQLRDERAFFDGI